MFLQAKLLKLISGANLPIAAKGILLPLAAKASSEQITAFITELDEFLADAEKHREYLKTNFPEILCKDSTSKSLSQTLTKE